MNNLYEYGGACDVVIRCNSERTINGKVYKTNEPVTIIRDVFVNLGYSETLSESRGKNNISASRVGLPDSVVITNVPLTEKIGCLISSKTGEKMIGKYYDAIADEGVIFLPEAPADKSIFIYHNNNSIEEFTVEKDKILGQFIEGEKYLVFYYVPSYGSCFNFDTPHYGYFSLDIYGKGNTDKNSQDIYINIPAVSLVSVPIFDLINGSILNAPLRFVIIHQNQEKGFYHIGG